MVAVITWMVAVITFTLAVSRAWWQLLSRYHESPVAVTDVHRSNYHVHSGSYHVHDGSYHVHGGSYHVHGAVTDAHGVNYHVHGGSYHVSNYYECIAIHGTLYSIHCCCTTLLLLHVYVIFCGTVYLRETQ